jgi:hypothetical protein
VLRQGEYIMNKTTFCSLALAAIAAGSAPAFGEITYLSQSRGISASALPEADGAGAADFSTFQAHRSVYSMYGTGASAGQYSTLGAEGMYVDGSVYAHGGMQYYPASADCSFDVTFVIDQARPFRFWGGLFDSSLTRQADLAASLTGPDGLIFSSASGGSWNINDTASPGLYRLTLSASVSAAGGPMSNSGSFYSGFVIPAPGWQVALIGVGIASVRRRR